MKYEKAMTFWKILLSNNASDDGFSYSLLSWNNSSSVVDPPFTANENWRERSQSPFASASSRDPYSSFVLLLPSAVLFSRAIDAATGKVGHVAMIDNLSCVAIGLYVFHGTKFFDINVLRSIRTCVSNSFSSQENSSIKCLYRVVRTRRWNYN